jgi:uncharacterized protein
VAYGIAITPARLARVERAEADAREWLRANGFEVRDLRVRDLGETARLEVDAALVGAVRGSGAVARVREAGFGDVAVEAFRSGSMNDLLPDPERYR